MQILILGGTKFLGRYLVEAALERGHQVTVFNRGQTNPDLFPVIKKLRGDRAGNIEALRGHRWDAAIDTSGQVSRDVRATSKLLSRSVEHYTFISSVSVYADFSRRGLDETAATRALPPEAVEENSDATTYGARKALCENAAEESMPGRVLNLRPGIIVGPHDFTGRFTYWVRRVARGGEVLAPEHPKLPMQLIDVRDLANWTIKLVEKKQTGTFNVTGPKEPLTFGQMLEGCTGATGSSANFTWVDGRFLIDNHVKPFFDLPLWIPEEEASYAGHYFVNSNHAFQSELECRPIAQTVLDIVRWHCEQVHPGDEMVGLTFAREQELLRAWRNKG